MAINGNGGQDSGSVQIFISLKSVIVSLLRIIDSLSHSNVDSCVDGIGDSVVDGVVESILDSIIDNNID